MALAVASGPGVARTQDTTLTLSPRAAAYLADALAIIRDNALWADSVEWRTLRAATFDSAAGARVPVDTYRAIRFALGALGDRHSFLQLSRELLAAEQRRLIERGLADSTGPAVSRAGPTAPFVERRIPEGHLHRLDGERAVARVVVPRTGALAVEEFATRLHDTVRTLASQEPCGWIVDLRGNTGGNMWPMLAGVGPLLGGTHNIGSFVGRDGIYGTWYYRDGEAGMTGVGGTTSFVGARIRGEPFAFDDQPPVAVLIDAFTGSSGEAVAIAFKGRPATRFFGQPTAGVSTSNSGFRLADSANLVITVGVDADRTGRLYPRDVLPDERVAYNPDADDTQIAAAIAWLRTQPPCLR
jgi:hypothetical protein